MKLKNLKMEGFVTYEEQEVRLDNLTYASIIGSNGAGKSTIFQAVLWAIYGTPRIKGDSDSIVNLLYDSTVVELEFEAEGTDHKISRIRRRNNDTKINLYTWRDGDWVKFGSHLQKDIQARILELVGISEDAWRSLVHMSADEGNRFISAKSPERRAILTSLIPEIASYSELEELAREEFRIANREVETIERDITSLESSISSTEDRITTNKTSRKSLDVTSAKRRVKELNAELSLAGTDAEYRVAESAILSIRKEIDSVNRESALEIKSLESEIRETVRLISSVEDYDTRIESLESELSSEKDNLESLNADSYDLDMALNEAEEELELVSARVNRLVKARGEALGTVNELNKRRKAVTDNGAGTCYVCQSDITDSKYESLLKEIDDELSEFETEVKKYEKHLIRANDEEDAMKIAVSKANRAISALERSIASSATRISSLSKELRRDRENAKDSRSRLSKARPTEDIEEELASLKTSLEKKVDSLEVSLKEKEQVLDGLETVDTRRIKADLENEEKTIRLYNELKGAAKELSNNLDEYESNLEDKKTLLKETNVRVGDLDFLVKALRPSGIPSLLLDGVLQEIEVEQNKILSSIPGSENFRVEFRTKKANKKGTGTQDVLDIIVHDGTGVERAIESFSSGERVRLTISNMFAMAKVFRARNPEMISTIMLDEPLGALDKDAVPAFVDVLQGAINIGVADSILVVSHDDKVIDALPQTIEVFKSDLGSVIEVR